MAVLLLGAVHKSVDWWLRQADPMHVSCLTGVQTARGELEGICVEGIEDWRELARSSTTWVMPGS